MTPENKVPRIDERLESIDYDIRNGIPVDFSEAMEVICYRMGRNRNRKKTWFEKIKEWFK